MRALEVSFKNEKYPVYIGAGLFGALDGPLAGLAGRACLVITDENVGALYGKTVCVGLTKLGARVSIISVPAGEASKSADMLDMLYNAMLDAGVTRKDCVVALGGGVVGDLAGYACATFLRGVPFIQMPTTLLSQVDSSVGGKVAVNLPRGKNLVGTFYNPICVVSDTGALDTLDKRQVRCGMAEVVKYGAICDGELFARAAVDLAQALENIDELVHRCCVSKAAYVARDPMDTGCRMELNFGHTLGHALEAAAGYGVYTHGEAISIGMAEAARWGELLGVTPQGVRGRLILTLDRLGLPTRAPKELLLKSVGALRFDKKAGGETLSVVLLEKIGRAKVVPVPVTELVKLITGGTQACV